MNVSINYKDKSISFHDNPVKEFCYDIFNGAIKMKFCNYYDINLKCLVDKECDFIISNWEKVKTSVYKKDSDEILEKIENNIGILVEIFEIDFKDKTLIMTAEKIDGKIITFYFENPIIEILF